MSEGSTRRQALDIWRIAYLIILVLAVVSRTYMLGARAMSHDETTHAKFSWNLYVGRGFRHDPMMHGPLLFEATAFLYALFGVSDFTARLYCALVGVGLVMAPWLLRRWLGRHGALVASVMLLISPAVSYYSRYTRHDVPMALTALLLLWAVLRYVERRESRWLYGMAVVFPLMYASKENAYIYTAIFLGLWAVPFLIHLGFQAEWLRPQGRWMLLGLVVMVGMLGGLFVLAAHGAPVRELPVEGSTATVTERVLPWWGRMAAAGAFLLVLAAVPLVYYGAGEATLRAHPLFDVLMALGTLTLPLGSAFLIKFAMGVEMTSFYDALMKPDFAALPAVIWVKAAVAVLTTLVAAALLGMWWDGERWPTFAFTHYGIFALLYTTFFTWGWGLVTGLVGGLSYWMAQQGVRRGKQPWYYYPMLGGMYEYLPLLLAAVAGVMAVRHALRWRREGGTEGEALTARYFPLFLLLWSLLSWVAYIYAGEKMPWLFVHIVLPHILLAAWGVGRWLDGLRWRDLRRGGWGVPVALTVGGAGAGLLAYRLATGGAVIAPVVGVLGGVGLAVWAWWRVGWRRGLRLVALTVAAVGAVLTLRAAVMLNYINGETAKEYLVYAHATPDVKVVLARIASLSWRLTGTPDQIKVAYGKDGSWPFYWYMETRYPNSYYYGTSPERERLLACPVVIAGKKQWGVVEPILGDAYVAFDYNYLWWPIEDYKGMTWARLRDALGDAEMRRALWEIWMWRDYRRYARLRDPEEPFTLRTWPHREPFRLYVRRDLASLVWRYGAGE